MDGYYRWTNERKNGWKEELTSNMIKRQKYEQMDGLRE